MIIKLGSKGADVVLIQQHLNKLGFIVASTGPGSPDKGNRLFWTYDRVCCNAFSES